MPGPSGSTHIDLPINGRQQNRFSQLRPIRKSLTGQTFLQGRSTAFRQRASPTSSAIRSSLATSKATWSNCLGAIHFIHARVRGRELKLRDQDCMRGKVFVKAHNTGTESRDQQGAHNTKGMPGSPLTTGLRPRPTPFGIKQSRINPTVGQKGLHIIEGSQRGIEIPGQKSPAPKRT